MIKNVEILVFNKEMETCAIELDNSFYSLDSKLIIHPTLD